MIKIENYSCVSVFSFHGPTKRHNDDENEDDSSERERAKRSSKRKFMIYRKIQSFHVRRTEWELRNVHEHLNIYPHHPQNLSYA